MSKNSAYWEKRAAMRLLESERHSSAYLAQIQRMYTQAYKNVEKELTSVYKNYAKDTGLDVQKLKTLLTASETKKTWEQLKRQGLDEYVKLNYKARISRLEQVQAQIYAKIKQLYAQETVLNTLCYVGVINKSYIKTIFDIQNGTGYYFTFSTLDKNLIETLLSERWSGKNYSERIWKNTDLLASSISEIVGGALLSGQSIERTAKQIRDRFNVGKFVSKRLVRSEVNHFNNEADALALEELDVEFYIFVSVLDSKTSETCRNQDGKKYKLKDRKVGVNYPPMHAFCRSKTRGFINEEVEKALKRRAKNPETGKTEIIDNMTFKEWWEKQKSDNGANINTDALNIESYKNITGPNYLQSLSDNVNIKLRESLFDYDDLERGQPMSFKEADSGNVNPNYTLGGGYKTNCTGCVAVYEARRRGYNLEALPNENNPFIKKLMNKPFLAWRNKETLKHPQYIDDKSITNAEECLAWLHNVLQPNARYALEYYRKNGPIGSGHIVTIEMLKNGTIRYYDPQIDKVIYTNENLKKRFINIRYEYNGEPCPPKIFRIDDIDFNFAYLKAISKEK